MPSKGRRVPPLSEQEQERRRALAALDIPALRAWAKRYAAGLLGDDAIVLRSAHEARAIDFAMPAYLRRESEAWLKEHPLELPDA